MPRGVKVSWKDLEKFKKGKERRGMKKRVGLFLDDISPFFGMNSKAKLIKRFDSENEAIEYAHAECISGIITGAPLEQYQSPTEEDMKQARAEYLKQAMKKL